MTFFHGQGLLIKKDLGKYEGKWLDGVEHGQGSLTFINGYSIVGEWMGGYPVKGTSTWPNGNMYCGAFKDWKWHGNGEITWPDGHKLEGEFSDGEPWETIEYDKYGIVIGKIMKGVETIEILQQRDPSLETDAAG